MRATDTFLAVVTIGTGVMLILFWSIVVASGRLGRLAGARRDFGWHLAAEYVTGALLIAGGIGIATEASWGTAAAGIGLGALVYAIVESPGHYLTTGLRPIAVLLGGTWVVVVPAAVLLLSRA